MMTSSDPHPESGSSLLDRYQQFRTRRFLRHEEHFRKWLPGWRTQARRRLLVGALTIMFAFMLAVGLVCLFSMTIGPLLWLPAVIVFLPLWTVLQIVSGRQGDAPRDALDEWEIAQRNNARSIGLTVTQSAVLLAAVFLVVAGSTGNSSDATTYAGGIWVLTTLLIGGCTPTMILAWSRPDPEPEEFADH